MRREIAFFKIDYIMAKTRQNRPNMLLGGNDATCWGAA
jgi:hypothetical protein